MMIREAPRSAARRTGVLAATAPSINASPLMSTAGKTPGIAVLAKIASTAGPLEKANANALLGRRHNMKWNFCVFDPRTRQVRLDHATQLTRIDDVSSMPDQAKSARQSKRKNVRAPQPRPDLLQSRNTFGVRRAGKIARVDRANRRADHKIRF